MKYIQRRVKPQCAGDRRGVVSVANPGKYNPRGTDSQRMPVPIACLAGVSTELADHWQRADYSLGSTPSGGTLSPIERAATTGWAGSTSVSSGRKLEETEGANTGETGRVADSRERPALLAPWRNWKRIASEITEHYPGVSAIVAGSNPAGATRKLDRRRDVETPKRESAPVQRLLFLKTLCRRGYQP